MLKFVKVAMAAGLMLMTAGAIEGCYEGTMPSNEHYGASRAGLENSGGSGTNAGTTGANTGTTATPNMPSGGGVGGGSGQ